MLNRTLDDMERPKSTTLHKKYRVLHGLVDVQSYADGKSMHRLQMHRLAIRVAMQRLRLAPRAE